MENLEAKTQTCIEPTVYVIDDDRAIREALVDLLMVTNRKAAAYSSGDEFLSAADTTVPGCVVVDLRMPGGSGLEVQSELTSKGSRLPVIFLTGSADVPASVEAMKAGAIDFITKPFDNQHLLDAIDRAIRMDCDRRELEAERAAIQSLVDTLTAREQEVMRAVVSGLMNKQVAYELGISEITVKLHRMSVMRKMQSRSLADLVRKFEKLQNSLDRE